jgi:hypothetical protein
VPVSCSALVGRPFKLEPPLTRTVLNYTGVIQVRQVKFPKNKEFFLGRSTFFIFHKAFLPKFFCRNLACRQNSGAIQAEYMGPFLLFNKLLSCLKLKILLAAMALEPLAR